MNILVSSFWNKYRLSIQTDSNTLSFCTGRYDSIAVTGNSVYGVCSTFQSSKFNLYETNKLNTCGTIKHCLILRMQYKIYHFLRPEETCSYFHFNNKLWVMIRIPFARVLGCRNKKISEKMCGLDLLGYSEFSMSLEKILYQRISIKKRYSSMNPFTNHQMS